MLLNICAWCCVWSVSAPWSVLFMLEQGNLVPCQRHLLRPLSNTQTQTSAISPKTPIELNASAEVKSTVCFSALFWHVFLSDLDMQICLSWLRYLSAERGVCKLLSAGSRDSQCIIHSLNFMFCLHPLNAPLHMKHSLFLSLCQVLNIHLGSLSDLWGCELEKKRERVFASERCALCLCLYY